MLRKDASAAFLKTGVWMFSRYRFQAGGAEASRALSNGTYGRMLRRQHQTPVLLLLDTERRRSWWMFRDAFYCDDASFSEVEVKALLLVRESQRDRRVQRAVALMEQGSTPAAGIREVIPGAVKRAVWKRDGGRCVSCGGRERLEFDHIIPVSMGGASTARNLQLLCESCNRQKGGSLA